MTSSKRILIVEDDEPFRRTLGEQLRLHEDFVIIEADTGGKALELAKLRSPVDAFFDEVTVNCDDPKLRQNRLRLLSRIRATLCNVADFSRIEG